MIRLTSKLAVGLAFGLVLASCGSDQTGQVDGEIYAGIGPGEAITLVGTEPFWTIQIQGETLNYSNPDHPEGRETLASRFSGNGGLGISGTLDGQAMQIAVTPGQCNDAMSDRVYPFTATIRWGEDTLFGCGYTDTKPFTGSESP